MNVMQLKLNAIIRAIRDIAVEIENLKKRVSDLELAQLVNIDKVELLPNEAKQ